MKGEAAVRVRKINTNMKSYEEKKKNPSFRR